MNKIKVNFTFDNKSVSCDYGAKLSEICAAAGYEQDLVCGGNGKCKKCTVTIRTNGKTRRVLSCQYEVTEDTDVIFIESLAKEKIKILTANTSLECVRCPRLKLLRLKGSEIVPAHCGSLTDVLETIHGMKITARAARSLSQTYDPDNPDTIYNFVIYDACIIDMIGDGPVYAAAVDIGTTTVAMYVYDMEQMRLIGTYSALNDQTTLGADVIARIGYCIKNKDGTQVMREKITQTINHLIQQAQSDGVVPERIYNLALCGNATMQHLFFGFYPENLGKVPFISATIQSVDIAGADSMLTVNDCAVVTFLPLLGGFVGADTTSVLASLPRDGKARLMIDLGTNGELAAGSDDTYTVVSTACGPALEGAGLRCGMRAAAGAIEHFAISCDKKITLKMIGGTAPEGICGSGIIDILAELIRNGVINERGRMLGKTEYEKKYGADDLSARIEETETDKKFVLSRAEESSNSQCVYFSQKDVRQIQLAKAAIYTGCEIITQNFGEQREDLSEICLAGAFGNYIDIENAQYIGLLPDYPGVPVRGIGNGAGTGAQLYLLDAKIKNRCENIRRNATHVELNFTEGFQDAYFNNMLFKNLKIMI